MAGATTIASNLAAGRSDQADLLATQRGGDFRMSVGGLGKLRSSNMKAFCGTPVLRDYLAPLKQVPLSSRFGSSGKLGVGPSSLRIHLPREGPVPLGKGVFGARGSVLSRKGLSRPLKWTVVSELERVQGTGQSKILKRKQQYVAKVSGFNGRQFGFASNGLSAGIYRLTVEIRANSGKVLEAHQEAFRAMPPRSDLELMTSFTRLAPGEKGYLRIDNVGTVGATYGANYRLWTASGEEIAVNPIFGDILYSLPAGQAGPCMTFTVPDGLTPGQYRLGSRASDSLRRNQLLTATFSVT